MTDKGYLHRRSENFGKLPEPLMHDPTVTDGAKVLYTHLHWRYGSDCKNFEGRKSMAQMLDISETAVSDRITELVERDWVIVVTRTNKRGRTTNFYHVFEYQADCIAWRQVHRIEKPAVKLDANGKPKCSRKSRRGIGGQPSHKRNGTSTQVEQGKSTQVDPPLINSGLRQYPDLGSYPERVDTDVSTPQTASDLPVSIAAASAPPLSVQVFSQVNKAEFPQAPAHYVWVYSTDSTSQCAHLITGSMTAPVLCKQKLMHRSWYKPAQTYNQREPCPDCQRIAAEPKPTKTKQPPQFGDVLVALARHYFKATEDPLLKVTRGRAGKVAKALLDNFPDATPEQVRDSAAAWKGEHLPLGADTLPDYFRKWKQENSNGNNYFLDGIDQERRAPDYPWGYK